MQCEWLKLLVTVCSPEAVVRERGSKRISVVAWFFGREISDFEYTQPTEADEIGQSGFLVERPAEQGGDADAEEAV
ncbi:hypothetical protein [Luteolibacter sp. AS25]|uniref:hypothetical protein n=1 Tax=Luteolibacter sp. AS25 TaxID=3135776 RepID=UPI00398B7C19